jgi:hypothetical protein
VVINFTDDVDLTARGKRVAALGFSAAGASTVNIRRGSLAGAVVWSCALPAAGTFNFSWPSPIYVAEGVFVECTAAVSVGSIDLL